ncbi:MAG: MBOAT family protein [Lachnospiraceae bacterium]|nr:MBOAT family protein [Lachnospiraceae bacterium]
MLFNSLQFIIFFPIVVIVYFIIPKKVRYIWLLISSYYFYMSWNAMYALLLFASTFITYIGALFIDIAQKDSIKKTVMILGCVLNLSILFVYKYAEYTLSLISKLLSNLNISAEVPAFSVLLPVGISFYTLQALGYLIDVYRKDIAVEKNFLKYALFVSFFPQLVAGPIERSGNLLKQLDGNTVFEFDRAREGFFLMLWGYFLKVVLADRIAIYVDKVYSDTNMYGGYYLIIAALLFSIQVYCDFGGYSTIAMGASMILGIKLMDNFNAPFLADSVSSLWRGWHISLTSWFRDYVYIPLGGSRKGKIRKYINIMIIFLTSGLWHGANLTFAIWGGLNGIYEVVGEVLKPVKEKAAKALGINGNNIGNRLVKMVITYSLFSFAAIFFRANSLTVALDVIKSIFTCYNPWILFDGSLYTLGLDSKNFNLMLMCIGLLIFADIQKKKGIKIREVLARQDYWCRIAVMVASICFILMFGIWGSGYDSAGFIYFQF